jgi:hypothetical protein
MDVVYSDQVPDGICFEVEGVLVIGTKCEEYFKKEVG